MQLKYLYTCIRNIARPLEVLELFTQSAVLLLNEDAEGGLYCKTPLLGSKVVQQSGSEVGLNTTN